MLLTQMMWNDVRKRVTLLDERMTTFLAKPIVLAPAYGVGRNGVLTAASTESTVTALLKKAELKCPVVLSSAIDTLEKRLKILAYPSTETETWLVGCQSSYDEAAGFATEMQLHASKNAFLVAEPSHLPRFAWALTMAYPAVSIVPVTFKARMEPFIGAGVKGWGNHRFLWEWHNTLAYLATPRLMKPFLK